MPASFWPAFASIKTGIVYVYSMADNTANFTQVVDWKVAGKS
jgi:hypothetical protein